LYLRGAIGANTGELGKDFAHECERKTSSSVAR
jgi:hypothetical protein